MKLTVSGDPKHLPGAKIGLQLLWDAFGMKCDLTAISSGAPKADVNACYSRGAVAFGASSLVDCKSGAVTKYQLGGQFVVDDVTVGVILLDALDTVKTSVAMRVDKTTSCACEVVYKVKASDASAALAVSRKFSDVCSGKLAVSSAVPLKAGTAIDPVFSLHTTGDVAAKTTGSLSVQTDTRLNTKWGVQFATKI